MLFAKPSLLATIATIAVVSATASVPLPKRLRSAFASFRTMLTGSGNEIELPYPTASSQEIVEPVVAPIAQVPQTVAPQEIATDDTLTLRTSTSSDSLSQSSSPSPVLNYLPSFSTSVCSSVDEIRLDLPRDVPQAIVPCLPSTLSSQLVNERYEEYEISRIVEPCPLSLLDFQYVLGYLEKSTAFVSKNVFVLARFTRSATEFSVVFEIWKRSQIKMQRGYTSVPEDQDMINEEVVDNLKAAMAEIFKVDELDWTEAIESTLYGSF